MQFAVQDIRRWGSLKIFNNYFSSDLGRQSFIERLRTCNFMLEDYKCSAYSIPRIYKDVYYDIHNQYYGMIRFVDMCEPLIRSMDKPDDSVKRKIRNQWDSMWKCLKDDLSLNDNAFKAMKELGIRLLFSYTSNEYIHIDPEIFEFYNAILTWYTYTVSESAIANLELSSLELIEFMVINDSDKFVYNIQNGFDKGGSSAW